MLVDLMEVTPLPGIFLCLSGVLLCLSSVLLCLRSRLVVLRQSVFSLSFILWVGAAISWLLLSRVTRSKLSCLLFELLLDFDDILVGRAQG
jgi:hypothetical protein